MTDTPSHDEKVAAVCDQVRALNGQSAHVDKGGVHHFVPLPGEKRFTGKKVDLKPLREVLEIDAEARVATAEPGVTFARLVEATLPHGLLPGVVPELEGITVGGAVAGCSVESMSWKLGGFHDTCLEYEVVTGDGRVLTLTPERDPLLFDMVHGSYGTLGILTKVRFRLYPAKPYVRLVYETLPSLAAFEARMRQVVGGAEHELVDGIIHAPDRCVLCLGDFVDEAPFTSSYRRLDIYYKSTATRTEDYLRTPDYLFRYDTECHWLSRTVPPLEWKPVRALLGRWFLGSTNLIRWSNRLAPLLGMKKRPDVVVDVFIPAKRFGEFSEWYERDFAYYPLWIVPYRIARPYPWIAAEHASRMEDELFIDCAIYGKPNSEPDIDWSQVLEEKTVELGGIKTLISRNHFTPDSFWRVYHRENYDAAKAALDPTGAFPHVYEKMVGRHA
jgi:FAD/FMN-containing dehydrogenase